MWLRKCMSHIYGDDTTDEDAFRVLRAKVFRCCRNPEKSLRTIFEKYRRSLFIIKKLVRCKGNMIEQKARIKLSFFYETASYRTDRPARCDTYPVAGSHKRSSRLLHYIILTGSCNSTVFIAWAPNDFAYWTQRRWERMNWRGACRNRHHAVSSIRSLREKIISTIENYLADRALSKLKFCRKDEEFHFIKSVSFILPTPYAAYNLKDFIEIISKITIDSIYFHIFEARLRLEKAPMTFPIG